MSNKLKEINKKIVHYFFDDKINIKNLDPNKIKIDEKSYKNILVYHIGYLMVKYLSYTTVINKIDGYIEESNGNKYLMIVPTDETKDTLQKYE